MKYKTLWAEPAHVRRRTCTHRQTLHCQTCASLREFPLSGEQASASEGCLHTHQHTARQPQVLQVKHQSHSASHEIYTIFKTTRAVMQVVGGGRGGLAGDTDRLAGCPVCNAFTHAYVSMITYRVDVYRTKLIRTSLLAGRGRPGADADQYRCTSLTQGLAGRGDGHQCSQDWGRSSILHKSQEEN